MEELENGSEMILFLSFFFFLREGGLVSPIFHGASHFFDQGNQNLYLLILLLIL